MAKIRNEYEVTVTPEGAWGIVHLHGETKRAAAHGIVQCYCTEEPADGVHLCNALGRADEAARRWLKEESNRKHAAKRKAEGNRTFTVKL